MVSTIYRLFIRPELLRPTSSIGSNGCPESSEVSRMIQIFCLTAHFAGSFVQKLRKSRIKFDLWDFPWAVLGPKCASPWDDRWRTDHPRKIYTCTAFGL
jgi:hypothetical protein